MADSKKLIDLALLGKYDENLKSWVNVDRLGSLGNRTEAEGTKGEEGYKAAVPYTVKSYVDDKVAELEAANLSYKTRELTADEVAALDNSANILKAYKTVSVGADGNEVAQVGDTVVVPKDKNLKSADFVLSKPGDTEGSTVAGQFLKMVYILADGSESTVYVDLSQLILESEVENGIQNVSGKLSIKVDTDNNEKDTAETPSAFLVVTANGIKIVGIKDEIDRHIALLDVASSADDAHKKGTNVEVTISETDGKVKVESVTEDYAEVTRTAHVDAVPASEGVEAKAEVKAAFGVKDGDGTKLVKASDLENGALYTDDKVAEEEAARKAQIAALAGDKKGVDTDSLVSVEVKTAKGEVSEVLVSVTLAAESDIDALFA